MFSPNSFQGVLGKRQPPPALPPLGGGEEGLEGGANGAPNLLRRKGSHVIPEPSFAIYRVPERLEDSGPIMGSNPVRMRRLPVHPWYNTRWGFSHFTAEGFRIHHGTPYRTRQARKVKGP